MKTKLTITELTHEDLVTFLSDALCQSYFKANYRVKDYDKIPKHKRNGECFEDKMADILLNHGTVHIFDMDADGEHYGNLEYKIEDDAACCYYVTLDDILEGFSLEEAQPYVMQLVNETDDAWTGYNLMQCVLFGEIIYG